MSKVLKGISIVIITLAIAVAGLWAYCLATHTPVYQDVSRFSNYDGWYDVEERTLHYADGTKITYYTDMNTGYVSTSLHDVHEQMK